MHHKKIKGFACGGIIGALGGLIGLGGAEFRLPVLMGPFGLASLEAVILNKAMSLIVVASALLFRGFSIEAGALVAHADIILNLLAGSLIGAWFAAGAASKMKESSLDKLILLLLAALACLMMWEALFGMTNSARPLFDDAAAQWTAGIAAGLLIGVVAAVLGVAGGELLIPTIVLLYGADVKLAGSLSLAVSLPTMIAGFARYSQTNAFAVVKKERGLGTSMAAGSILGAAAGGLMVGIFSPRILLGLLAVVLMLSAVKTFLHQKAKKSTAQKL